MNMERHDLRLRAEGGLIGLIPTACLVLGYFMVPDTINVPFAFIVFGITFLIGTLALYLRARTHSLH